jgi:hypothetical protein
VEAQDVTAVRWSAEQLDAHLRRANAYPAAGMVPGRSSSGRVGADVAAEIGGALQGRKTGDGSSRPDGALGRMAAGRMNETESRYAQHLDAERHAGRVLWWRFEGITLLLADRCRLTPDFAVLAAEGQMELHEVKGSLRMIRDDALVKLKVAAAQYPLRVLVVTPQRGGGWVQQTIGGEA